MSDVNSARRADTQVVLNGADISVFVNDDLLSLSYTDNEEDEADDLQIKVLDRKGNWLQKWLDTLVLNAAEGGEIVSKPPQKSGRDLGESSGTGGNNSGGALSYKVTATSGVNVRSTAAESGKKLGKLPFGYIVEVKGFSGSWAKINYSGRTAYIKSANLKAVGGSGGSGNTSGGSGENTPQIGERSGSRGLKISAAIVRRNWGNDGKDDILECGEFELDSVEASAPPATVTIKATALPYSSSIRQTLKSKSWENTELHSIAKEIAAQNGMGLMFESAYNPKYARMEQYRTSDIAFLQKLCHDAGASLKVTNRIVVIFDQAKYEDKKAIRVIKFGEEGGYTKYRLSTGTNDTYTSCRVSYTDPNGTVISAVEYAENYSEDNGGKNQCLEISQKVNSVAEAQLLAHKMLRLHNKLEYEATFDLPGNTGLAAGCTVELSGFGAWNGKYIIKQAKHSISRSSGYVTQIKLRKVLKETAVNAAVGSGDNSEEIDRLARECIRGDWGNGQVRIDKLTAAGHSYEKVQKRVNEILYG